MKIYLEKAIFNNRVPFDKLELDFSENEIAVISAVNGRGKTTILSHIVDAFHEMARPYFPSEFNGKENKLYRISSATINNLDQKQPSIVYLRFKTIEGNIDYLDIRNICTEDQYNQAVSVEDKIHYSEIKPNLEADNYVKKLSSNFVQEKARQLFQNNILTYFPSYRFEIPGYLNDPYKVKVDFKMKNKFSGYLDNPIEVISGLPQLVNWIMDVVLDLSINKNPLDNMLWNNLNLIITQTLISKNYGNLRFGIGPRGFASNRIQVLENKGNGGLNDNQIYPSIFNISSGESAMLCLFGELLRQADNYKNNINLEEISGIVLIDEVDKHLHIKLQKEILPKLLKLFHNIQFVVSSHSPFLSMGLAEEVLERSRVVDLDNLSISKDPTTNELYNEVYKMMIGENERFKEMYHSLEQKVKDGTKPLIITEGKTDIQHILKAKEKIGITDCDVDFFNAESDSKLIAMLEQLCKIKQPRKIIGIFDRDVPKVISVIEKDNNIFKDYKNNVYAFCIPIPTDRERYTNISIEFYFTDAELKKKKDGKCLYFDNELNFDRYGKLTSPRSSPQDNFDKKIFCENIGSLEWIHSKSRFADLVENDDAFTNDFDFSKFNLIFDKVKTIINPVEEVVCVHEENTNETV